jgi:outer membrane protein OmpU
MNNFKKVGLTALAGSLVAFSAHAGELSVSGGANLTHKWGSTTPAGGTTGKSLGMDKDVAFTGSGELDNGTTFSFFTATTDTQADLSSGAMTISTPSFGSFLFGHNSGAGHYKYDEEVPTAYEQLSDIDLTLPVNKVGDFMDNNHVTYTSPTFEFGGASLTVDVGYAWDANDTETGDGGVAKKGNKTFGSGEELGVTIGYDALKIGVYGAQRENLTVTAAGADDVKDEFNGVWYAKYSFGPVSIGYSEGYNDSGVTSSAPRGTNVAKAHRTAEGFYESTQMGIAFNVNDNLSVSYSESVSTYDAQSHIKSGSAQTADVDQEIDAIQFAYSMGGMSIKAYQMEVTNPAHDEDADDRKITEIALGLAF